MRLHHLEVTAFGPFAETVRVDLDELSSAGLFLLSGPTGSGKTSVLDAVCFALYGDVPGDRSTARRLRCDQAAPDIAPRVVLEATLSGRRFRLDRSPAWDRPKKRGTGWTREHAKVTVSERVKGDWVHLSSRLDEAGDLVARLVGMNLTQFTQVALLPQGRFQEFLRARSEDRHALLQQLFRTRRFAEVERWLRERRVRLRRESDVAERAVATLVSRISEAAGVDQPGDPHEADLIWAHGLATAVGHDGGEAQKRLTRSQRAEADARHALDRARADHERWRLRTALEEELAALESRRSEHEQDLATLTAARRAAVTVPVARLVDDARRERDRVDALVGDLTPDDRDRLERDVETARVTAAAAQALRPRELRREELIRQLGRLEARQLAVAAQQRVVEVSARVAVGRELAVVESAVGAAHAAWLAAREHALGSVELLHGVREARLESMAGEIAGALAVGACCPVCGSAEHPHKAVPVVGAPDVETEKAAQRAVDDAKATEHLRETELRDLRARESGLRAQVDAQPLEDLQARLDAARADLARLGAGGADVSGLPSDPDHLHREASGLAARIDGLTDELRAAAREIDELLLGSGCEDLAALAESHRRRADEGLLALRRLDSLAAAEAVLADAEDALHAAATGAGFPTLESALAATRPERLVEALAHSTSEHEQRLAVLVERLAETPDVDRGDQPDLEAVEARHREAFADLGEAGGAVTVLTTRASRLTGLLTELEGALEAAAPLRAQLEVTVHLSAFVEGKSPDNRLQMRLSAYVLAYRFAQVVAAANTRLAGMSDQRYSLEHTGERAAGETRGGLSLRVRDDWSGEARDPVTLSGGETFVVSLALALGLSDVIAHETGAADLHTLFVDEGFGALDAETLDDVLDTLDSLRDGGRVVGVVSHVAEMRDRIPTQLVLAKSRRGSTVSVRR